MSDIDGGISKPRRTRKRAAGEGTIRKRADGLWVGRLMVGMKPNGDPDIRQVSAKTQALCRERLDALKAQVANGTLASTDMAGFTVAMLLDRWLATAKPNLRQSTYTRYERFVVHHFKPALGTKRLAKLSHADVESFLIAKRAESKKRGRGKTATVLTPRGIRHLYVVLKTALSWAIRKGFLTVNPMNRVDAPSVPRVEIVPLTPAETARLLNAAEEANDPLLALWELAAATGARKGELLGLRWDDIDLEAGSIRVRRTLVRVRNRQPEFASPKTSRSYRTIDIADESVESLKRHRDRQTFSAAKLGDAYADLNLVFATSLGTALAPESVSGRYKIALRRAGLDERKRVHDLRHGAATMMLAAGEPITVVSEQLGHAGPEITMRVYGHAVPGARKRAAEALGAALRAARQTPPEAQQDEAASS